MSLGIYFITGKEMADLFHLYISLYLKNTQYKLWTYRLYNFVLERNAVIDFVLQLNKEKGQVETHVHHTYMFCSARLC